MRDTCVVAGQILVRVAARRGHPLDWIETPPDPTCLPNLPCDARPFSPRMPAA